MPQLKKVVLATGSRLIYTDQYEDAVTQLAQFSQPFQQITTPASGTAPPVAVPASANGAVIQQIRDHLRRYRDLAAQGKWAEAGKELEAIEAAVRQ